MKFWIIVSNIISISIVICSQESERIFFPGEVVTESPETMIKPTIVASPKFQRDWMCGLVPQYGLIAFGHIENKEGETDNHPVYHLNVTAEKLASEGFNIQVNAVGFDDVLCNFTYSNTTYKETLAYSFVGMVLPTGGKPAAIARSYYMAQIGERTGDSIKWLCDGALINHRWILTAAHCFTDPGTNPNVVRLGDHNLTDPSDPHQTAGPKLVRDYPIHQLVPYPEFKASERYHDIALIQIPRRVPRRSHNIFPICLPWDSETNKDLVGLNVTLTGWGATEYRGPKTPILQEVNLTVFDTLFCDIQYADIPENKRKYPQGITEDNLLCVGWHEDGKDACGGDSGGPIVYLKDDFDESEIYDVNIPLGNNCDGKDFGSAGPGRQDKRYVLAGIVSGGYGCGLKDFPGIYIPVNKPNYLQWIKDVAFTEYV